VAYQIQATLVLREHKINASEALTYKNLTGQSLQTFPFHLYLNAFQPQSTFMTEVRLHGTRGNGPGSAWNSRQYGSETVTKLEVDGMGDLTNKIQFIHPDDSNTQSVPHAGTLGGAGVEQFWVALLALPAHQRCGLGAVWRRTIHLDDGFTAGIDRPGVPAGPSHDRGVAGNASVAARERN
jgi:hypothetical protein